MLRTTALFLVSTFLSSTCFFPTQFLLPQMFQGVSTHLIQTASADRHLVSSLEAQTPRWQVSNVFPTPPL